MSINLTTLDYLNGLFSLLVVTVGAVFGILIAIKYFNLKRKLFLYWGIALIGLYLPWWPSAFSFVSVLITGRSFSLFTYILIGNILTPLFLMLWMIGFTDMVCPDKKKIILLIYACILTAAEIYVITFLIVDPTTHLGEFTGVFDIKYKSFMMPYLLFYYVLIFITGILFARKSIKSDEHELRFKGKTLVLAFPTYPLGGIFDAIIELNEITLIIVRSILMLGAILFYIGFFPPKFVRRLFKLNIET